MSDKIYRKFAVARIDLEAEKRHADCQHFVLDLTHDPHALQALFAYGRSAQKENPELAEEVRKLAQEFSRRQNRHKIAYANSAATSTYTWRCSCGVESGVFRTPAGRTRDAILHLLVVEFPSGTDDRADWRVGGSNDVKNHWFLWTPFKGQIRYRGEDGKPVLRDDGYIVYRTKKAATAALKRVNAS